MHSAGAGEGEGPLPPADGHICHWDGGWVSPLFGLVLFT